MRYITMVAAVLALAGCADGDMVVETKLVGSDFCKIVPAKLTWDVADTKPTIRGIRRFNGKWDARCLGSPDGLK